MGQHGGGSIVDTARATMSPERIEKDNEARLKDQKANKNQKEDQP
jgi:hypothetical protein